MKKPMVFLGGTVNHSTWREQLIAQLEIDYFNPVVDDWNEEAYQRELEVRKTCDFNLYVLTPKMLGFYSIAELVDDAHKQPKKTVFCFLEKDDDAVFDDHQIKSMQKTAKLVSELGVWCFDALNEVARFLNAQTGANA